MTESSRTEPTQDEETRPNETESPPQKARKAEQTSWTVVVDKEVYHYSASFGSTSMIMNGWKMAPGFWFLHCLEEADSCAVFDDKGSLVGYLYYRHAQVFVI